MPAPVRRKLLFLCLSISASALVLAGSATGSVGAPPAESPNARGIQDIYWVLVGVAGVIFVLVEGALLLFVIRYRNRGRPRDVEGPQVRGHTRLELIWTAIPVLILVGIMAVVFYKLPGIKDVPAAGAAGPKLTVHVEGRQFYWRYTYPNGAVSIDELVAPAQRPVELIVTAPARDVIHSWWVPPLAGKIDAIPGKVNHTWFEADHPAVYQGQCAEFCGIQHALMLTRVRIVPATEYASWVTRQLHISADIGRQTFLGACGPCHGPEGKGLIGPPLQGNATLASRARLFVLLEHGKRAMPPVGKDWSQRELNDLAAYVQKEFASGG